jgi:NAD(P)-dependent dehydrogenase (short-subunit alcohol dehydrogenase family)
VSGPTTGWRKCLTPGAWARTSCLAHSSRKASLRVDSSPTSSGRARSSGSAAARRWATRSELGAPDALVYNVGVLRPDSPTGGGDQDWADNTAVNVLGARVAADAVLPALRDGRGSLLFTGGGYALHPSKKFSSLSVGKAALRAYVQLLHDQQAGTGVHATSVTITAEIGSGVPRFDPAVIAAAYLELHRQPESEWQHELVY